MPDEGGERDNQGGKEQPIAIALRALLPLLGRRGLRFAAAEQMSTGYGHESKDQHAVAKVAQQVAEPETDRHQRPEERSSKPLWVARIASASDREADENGTGEDVEPVQVDHRRLRSFRSRSRSRAPWIAKAQTAVGIAQTES